MNHGWEKKRLGDICIYQRGLTYSKDDEVDKSSKSVLRANNIDLETFTLNFDDLKYLREDFYIDPKYLLSKDSILICMSSGSKSHLGKVAFVERDFDYAFGGFMGLITPKTNSRYLYLFMTSPFFRSHLQKITNGININNLKFSTLQDLFVPLPNAEIQSKVVKELDRITVLIELKRNQLKDLDTLAQSLFYETFGDPIENPKGWESILLEECVNDNCPISYGIVQPGEDVANGTPLVRPVDFGANRCVFNKNLKHVSPSISESYKRTILKGDEILICVRGTTGLVKLSHTSLRGANVTRGIVPIQIKSQLSKIYIYEYLKRERAQSYIQSYTKGIALKQINLSDLRSLPILLPPVSLQNEFAEKIEAIEEQKRLIESSISDLETLLASRMDYWFND